VEEKPVSEADALARKHPISVFSLDALTAGAAKLRPDRLALTEAGPGARAEALTYAQFDGQVRALAQHLLALGLAPGERVLIVTSPRTACVVAAIGALAAGLEPMLVPIGLDAGQLAAIGVAANCAAIAGPTSYGTLNMEETLFEAAAQSEMIRFVAILGPGEADDAIDLAPERLQGDGASGPATSDLRPRIGTLDLQRRPVFHEQSALLVAALDLVGQAEIAASSQLLSTLAPASFASLVTGPVASLLSGAPLTLFGPFETAAFVASLDKTAPSHAVVPASILPDLAQAGLLQARSIPTAIAVARDESAILPVDGCALIEVHAGADEGGVRIERKTKVAPKVRPILSGEVLAPVGPARAAERAWR
jgi:hypothetical protein